MLGRNAVIGHHTGYDADAAESGSQSKRPVCHKGHRQRSSDDQKDHQSKNGSFVQAGIAEHIRDGCQHIRHGNERRQPGDDLCAGRCLVFL